MSAGGATTPTTAVNAAPKIAKYDVLTKLASGGMAEIFIAQRQGAAQICVIKQLHEHLAKDPIVANRFLREAQVAFLLDHPNIARILDADFEGKNVYLAMEFIAGQDIESMMFKLMEQQKMLPPALSVSATRKVLLALNYAHDHKGPDGRSLEIVHRDLSPRNVMITYDGDVKVIDFGLARTNLGEFRTAPGMVLGTLRYMSPEQAVAEPVDKRSDIYTWAVVLYEMLSGRPLVMGANAHEVLHAVVTQVPRPLSELNPSLPKGLDAVLERGLAKDRRDRFSNAFEFCEALSEAAGDLGGATEDQIGAFVTELFPEEYGRTLELIDNMNRGEAFIAEPTRYEAARDLAHAQTVMARLPTAPIKPAELPTVEQASMMRSQSVVLTRTAPRPQSVQSTLSKQETHLVTRPATAIGHAQKRLALIAVAAVVMLAVALGVVVKNKREREAKVEEALAAATSAPKAQAQPAIAARPLEERVEARPEVEAEARPKPQPVLTAKARPPKKEPAERAPVERAPAEVQAAPAKAVTSYDVAKRLIDSAEKTYRDDPKAVRASLALLDQADQKLREIAKKKPNGSCVNRLLLSEEIEQNVGAFRKCLTDLARQEDQP